MGAQPVAQNRASSWTLPDWPDRAGWDRREFKSRSGHAFWAKYRLVKRLRLGVKQHEVLFVATTWPQLEGWSCGSL
jgi:hypothetical protein